MRQWLIDAYEKTRRLYIYGGLYGTRANELLAIYDSILEGMTTEELKEAEKRWIDYNPFERKT